MKLKNIGLLNKVYFIVQEVQQVEVIARQISVEGGVVRMDILRPEQENIVFKYDRETGLSSMKLSKDITQDQCIILFRLLMQNVIG